MKMSLHLEIWLKFCDIPNIETNSDLNVRKGSLRTVQGYLDSKSPAELIRFTLSCLPPGFDYQSPFNPTYLWVCILK